ncbi:MAG: tRNA 2-thiouridine(34) synthase MnmA [Planctomycetota bacterium]
MVDENKMAADEWKIKLLPPLFLPWEPKKELSRQIAVLMSGGVDSSVTAHLLAEQGWDVMGITMNIPVPCSPNNRSCCGVDAAFVCNKLGIAHYFVDVTKAFQKLILEPFRKAYAMGQTPNPCVDCNSLLKFSLLWDFLEFEFGVSYLATGHYARIIQTDGLPRLARAKDKAKDQSYFLYGIAVEELSRILFPLGELAKNDVRSIAEKLGLSVHDKPESMELCFAGEGDYRQALPQDQADSCGDITDMEGNRIGTHKGISNYTLGQRRGIGFAGGKPLYVGKINAEKNTIALGTRGQVSTSTIKASGINVLIPKEFAAKNRVFAKIRSYGDPHPCKIIDIGQDDMTVEFDQPQFAPSPGQKLVLYDSDDNIIAGGTIVS